MKISIFLKSVIHSCTQIRHSYFLISATAIILGTLSSQGEQLNLHLQGMEDYLDNKKPTPTVNYLYNLSSQNSLSTAAGDGTAYDSYTLPKNNLALKKLDVDAVNYPLGTSGASVHFVYGGNDYHVSGGSNYQGNTEISTSGGYATVLLGGNYGNADGASFVGNSSITITTNTFYDIAGASYLTHDVDSLFDGSTSVVVKDVLSYKTLSSGIEHSTIGDGAIAGGHMGGLRDSTSTGTASNNVITGDTNVLVDLDGHAKATFTKYITGGSALYAGVDSTIEGKSTLTITNAENITFSAFVTGAGLSYSKVTETGDEQYPAENSGLNKSNLTVGSVELNIDSGTYQSPVMGGGFSASGGDITTGNITSNITGGTFESYIIGGSAIGNTVATDSSFQSDHSAGKLISEDVVLNVSNIVSNFTIVGGHLFGASTIYDGEGNSSIGNITVNVGGYDSQGNALGGTYNSIYGGSRIVSANSSLFTQGKVTVNLETGSILANSEIAAAGHNSNSLDLNNTSSMTTEATEVKIGQDMAFGANVTVRGGYTAATEDHLYDSTVTGNKLLHFDDESYNNLGNTHFYTFDEVNVVQAGAHAQLEGNTTIGTLDSELLTKSGAGELSVEAGTSRAVVNVNAGRMNITTDQANSTVGTLNIASGATASTDALTISNGEVKGTGLSANDVTGAGTLLTNYTDVKQTWQQQDLEVVATEQFSMITGADVYLEALTTAELIMEDGSHLHTKDLLNVTKISIDDYLNINTVSSPFITAYDMVNDTANSFTFDFSAETIASMDLSIDMQPYLVADLDSSALATAQDKSFVFQIDGEGSMSIQIINGTFYYLGVINEDVYIFTNPVFVPEPTTSTLSLLALAGLLARRRRK